MPYINELRKKQLGRGDDTPQNAGELNYAITRTIVQYLQEQKLSYQRINDILGALEGAKLEFYRRVAGHYEDYKIKENGDVYFVEGITTNNDFL